MIRRMSFFAGSAVLLAVMLAGCAQPGPVLMQDILYQAPTGTAPAPGTVVVGVSPLKDVRGRSASVLGKRVVSDEVQNDLVVQGTVSDLATRALKDALRSRGVVVKDAPSWDLASAPPRSEGAVLVIGGEIKELWADSSSRPLDVKTKATVQLRMSLADAAGAAAPRMLNLNSSVKRDDVVFSFEMVQDTLSEALTAALNQLLNDPELAAKLKGK